MKHIGIEKINVYPGSLKLDLLALAEHRNTNVDYIANEMMVQERSLVPLWEDTVTMVVNAANFLTEEEKKEVGLFIVATETGLDQEKAVSTWAHQYLKLPSACRIFEIKIACHAGAAALKIAESWLCSGLNKGKKALIVAADISYNCLNKHMAEFSLGAGAISLLISDKPDFAVIEVGKSGIHACDVTDVIRPLPWKEIAYDVEESLLTYMDGIEQTYQEYQKNTLQTSLEYFDYHIYHVPFPGISHLAHKFFLEVNGIYNKNEILDSFNQKVLASLHYPKKMGATYAGSIFLALFSLTNHVKDIKTGERIGIYSYGSGSCAEFFSMLVGEKAKEVIKQAVHTLEKYLEVRHPLSISAYENLENMRTNMVQQSNFEPDFKAFEAFYEKFYRHSGLLILRSINEHKRHYEFA